MKILFLTILICTSFLFPSSSFASHIELKPCVEIAHCVREEWEVNNIEKPFEEIKTFIENTPRTEIVEIDGDYLHACLLYTSPSPRDVSLSRMPSSA